MTIKINVLHLSNFYGIFCLFYSVTCHKVCFIALICPFEHDCCKLYPQETLVIRCPRSPAADVLSLDGNNRRRLLTAKTNKLGGNAGSVLEDGRCDSLVEVSEWAEHCVLPPVCHMEPYQMLSAGESETTRRAQKAAGGPSCKWPFSHLMKLELSLVLAWRLKLGIRPVLSKGYKNNTNMGPQVLDQRA